MNIKAKLRHYHGASRKVRLLTDLICKMDVNQAKKQLTYNNKRAARVVLKLLNSVIANAVNNFSLEEDNLYIQEAFVDEGPALKRWRPRAHGRASRVLKKTSHITLILGEKVPTKAKKKKTQKKEKITTKKVDLKEMKKSKNINKDNIKDQGLRKSSPKQAGGKLKSFIRKTGDK